MWDVTRFGTLFADGVPRDLGVVLCHDLIGQRLVFYLPDGYGVVGVLEDLTEYDLIIEPANPNYQDRASLYAKLPDGKLAIDRGAVRKIKRSLFQQMGKS